MKTKAFNITEGFAESIYIDVLIGFQGVNNSGYKRQSLSGVKVLLFCHCLGPSLGPLLVMSYDACLRLMQEQLTSGGLGSIVDLDSGPPPAGVFT